VSSPRDELLEAWRTNQRINLLLIDAIPAPGMKCTLSTRGGRDVAGQFAHLHNVRLWQLDKRAKDLTDGMSVFPAKTSPTKSQLRKALGVSGKAVETFLAEVLEGKSGRRGFRKGIFTTLAYFVAHESHHRGNILLTLKQSGNNPDKDARYAIWDWDRR